MSVRDKINATPIIYNQKSGFVKSFQKNVPFLNRKDAIISLHSQKKKGVQYVNVQYKVSRKSKDSAKVQQ